MGDFLPEIIALARALFLVRHQRVAIYRGEKKKYGFPSVRG